MGDRKYVDSISFRHEIYRVENQPFLTGRYDSEVKWSVVGDDSNGSQCDERDNLWTGIDTETTFDVLWTSAILTDTVKKILDLMQFLKHQCILCLLCGDAVIVFIQHKKWMDSKKLHWIERFFLNKYAFCFLLHQFFSYHNCLGSRIYFSRSATHVLDHISSK